MTDSRKVVNTFFRHREKKLKSFPFRLPKRKTALACVTGATGVIGWTVVQCDRCYRLDSWAVVHRDSGAVGQWYSVTKKSSELAKPHSYWVSLILVAISGYA